MLTLCEDFWLLESAVTKAGQFNTAALRDNIDSLTSPTRAGVSFTARYGPVQHDGAGALRHLAYLDGAFRYTSGDKPID
jgi:hypothetical protein